MDEVQRFSDIVRIPVTFDGETVYVEASILGSEEDVAGRLLDFGRVTRSIGAIAAEVGRAVRDLQPDNVKLEAAPPEPAETTGGIPATPDT